MSNKAKIRQEALWPNPIDDLAFRKIAESPFFCEEILRTILAHRPRTSLRQLAGAFRGV